MKKAQFIYLILLLCVYFTGKAQNVDSLINILRTQELTPQQQLVLYNDICVDYTYTDIEQMLLYAKEGLALAQKENNKDMLSKLTEHAGLAYLWQLKMDSSFIYLEEALDYALKTKNPDRESCVYCSLGSYYEYKSQYDLALEYYMKALPLTEKAGNKKRQVAALANIGGVHRVLMNNDRAIYYLEQAKTIVDEINYPPGEIKICYDLGGVYFYKDDYEKAQEYFLRALELSRTYNNTYYEIGSIEGLAFCYMYGLMDYEKAEEYVLQSLKLAEDFGEPNSVSSAWNMLSNIYRDQERYEECEYASSQAWAADSTNTNLGRNITSNIVLANIYLGNKERAHDFLVKNNEINMQYNDKSLHESLAEMEVKYETEKKEIRIALLEQERGLTIWLSIAGGALLLAFIGILFYRNQLKKQRIKRLEQEAQLIATQAVLDGETAERSRLARDLHDGLGGMLSVVKLNLKDIQTFSVMDGQDMTRFDRATAMLDESIGELRRVAHHMMPESLIRYGLKLSLEDFSRAIPIARFHYLGEDTRLDSRLEVMIYRCTFELVNNAVKYANASIINIQLLVDKNVIALTVQDDGIGFDPNEINLGTGLENIRTRVSAYNGKMIIHSAPGKGTEVSIEIEVISHKST